MISRRQALLGLFLLTACGSGPRGDRSNEDRRKPPNEDLKPLGEPPFEDNVDALFDVLIPAERDEKNGTLLSPGAREARPSDILSIDRFAALAVALGFLPSSSSSSPPQLEELDALGDGLRAALNANLDVLAFAEKPLTPFRDLPRAQKEAIVERAFDDDRQRPLMLVARAAAFFAYLGAITSDVGLVAIGYPPFEDFKGGVAVSGYPTKDADYTFNETPPSGGDDLSAILDEATGDLI
jgi:hypothetical protein